MGTKHLDLDIEEESESKILDNLKWVLSKEFKFNIKLIDLNKDRKNSKTGFIKFEIPYVSCNPYTREDILKVVRSFYLNKGYQIGDVSSRIFIAKKDKEKYSVNVAKFWKFFGVNVADIK